MWSSAAVVAPQGCPSSYTSHCDTSLQVEGIMVPKQTIIKHGRIAAIHAQVEGITIDILRQALSQAGEGRRHILGEMEKCSPPPRRELAEYTPRVIRKPVGQKLWVRWIVWVRVRWVVNLKVVSLEYTPCVICIVGGSGGLCGQSQVDCQSYIVDLKYRPRHLHCQWVKSCGSGGLCGQSQVGCRSYVVDLKYTRRVICIAGRSELVLARRFWTKQTFWRDGVAIVPDFLVRNVALVEAC
eukprot:1147287-Pelagomonas_calceolata.AAC.6